MRGLILVVVLGLVTGVAFGRASYTGYSGAPGRQNCAASCHGSGTGSITVTGFPENYSPGQTYLISIKKVSGSNISNFNASCRVGTGTTNAGTLAAGYRTAAYSATGETNGVHFSTSSRDSGTFNWTAPASGTGLVKLYVAGLQGSMNGTNTRLTLTSNEAAAGPGLATNPDPANNATGVLPSGLTLTWTAGNGATSHAVYLGTAEPLEYAGTTTAANFAVAQTLATGQAYLWRVDEINSLDTTTGTVWHFTTLGTPGLATNPNPADNATHVPVGLILSWTAGNSATSHAVYLGLTEATTYVGTSSAPQIEIPERLQAGQNYVWRVDEINSLDTTTGTIWHFTTLVLPGEAMTPSPGNGQTGVSPTLAALSWQTGLDAATHDVYFGLTAEPPLAAAGLTQAQYNLPAELLADTVYYWRVNEHNNSGMTEGPIWSFRTQPASDADGEIALLPSEFALGPVYPNPFNATVTIGYRLTQASDVTLAVYDVTGRRVAVLAGGAMEAGAHQAQWSPAGFGSGIYLVRLTAGARTLTTKIIALK